MKSNKFRMLRFLELRISHGTGALTREPWDLEQLLNTANDANYYQRTVREGAKRVVRIKDQHWLEHEGERYVALLIVLAESEYVDASYENIGTGEARTFPKEPGEGYRTEAHLVIRASPEMRGTMQVYPFVLEESPGLSPSAILSRIAVPLRHAGMREGKNAAGETEKWGPIVELAGLLSASLMDELTRGELDAFDLVQEYLEPKGLDEHDELRQRKKTLRIDVVDHPDAGRVRALIDRVRSFAREQKYSKILIRYTEADTKKGRSVELDVPEGADVEEVPLEKAVARTAKLMLAEPLNYDHTEVVQALAQQMAAKLHSESEEG